MTPKANPVEISVQDLVDSFLNYIHTTEFNDSLCNEDDFKILVIDLIERGELCPKSMDLLFLTHLERLEQHVIVKGVKNNDDNFMYTHPFYDDEYEVNYYLLAVLSEIGEHMEDVTKYYGTSIFHEQAYYGLTTGLPE